MRITFSGTRTYSMDLFNIPYVRDDPFDSAAFR